MPGIRHRILRFGSGEHRRHAMEPIYLGRHRLHQGLLGVSKRIAGAWLRQLNRHNAVARQLLHPEYVFSAQNTTWVSTHGLAHSCDIRKERLLSGDPLLPDLWQLFEADRADPTSVYLCTDAVRPFAEAISGRATRPFTLVTGNSTQAVGTAQNLEAALLILRHPRLRRWFAQNLAMEQPRIEPLPLGLDYHSAWKNPEHFGNKSVMPMHQEAELRGISSQAAPLAERELKVYCDWHFRIDRGDRELVLKSVDRNVAHFLEMRSPRDVAWRAQSRFAFVASPLGTGWDCHRTWEALVLGCIPIVSSSPVARLFEGLPVIVVSDWRQVNREFLAKSLGNLQQKQFDFQSLFLRSWKARFSGRSESSLPKMSIDEFRRGFLAGSTFWSG
jgi:hypothetical protein